MLKFIAKFCKLLQNYTSTYFIVYIQNQIEGTGAMLLVLWLDHLSSMPNQAGFVEKKTTKYQVSRGLHLPNLWNSDLCPK